MVALLLLGGNAFADGVASAEQSSVSASPTSVTADGSTTSTITVTLNDVDNNPVSGKTVTLAKTSGSGSPTISAASGPSSDSGVVTFTVTSTTAAADVFTATDTSDSVTVTQTATVTFTAGAATKLAYTTVPSVGTVGTAFSVTVQSQDANGNPANLSSDTTITLSKASGSGTLNGTLTGTIASGANNVTISTPIYSPAGTMTLTATASGGVTLTPVTSGYIVFTDPYTIVVATPGNNLGVWNFYINKNGSPGNVDYAGVIAITLTDTITSSFWNRDTMCAQLFTDISPGTQYGTTILSPAAVPDMNLPRAAWLVDNALLPVDNANYVSQLPPSDWVTNAAQGAGLQLAMWDIIIDGGDGFSLGNVAASGDANNPTPSDVLSWAITYETLSVGKASDSAYVYNNNLSGTPAQMLLGPIYTDSGPSTTFSIGNRVFNDNGAGTGGIANNGIQDGTEPGIANVLMDIYAADGSGNPTGSLVATTITDANGYYRFDGLPAGTYVVVVDVFGSGAALNGMITSTGWNTVLTLAGDLHDHGIDAVMGASSVLPGGIASVPVTVGIGLQPTGEPSPVQAREPMDQVATPATTWWWILASLTRRRRQRCWRGWAPMWTLMAKFG